MDGSALTQAKPPAGAPMRYLRQYELVEKVLAYQPDADERLLNAAYVFAVTKHGSQKRASGDPYFSHPVSVAGLLADLHLDQHTIIAGLLHDTVEDTDTSLDEIQGLFGDSVCDLVNGVTKLTQINYQSEAAKQAENFQKFILASTHDIRVLLVKLADRLHNMRTLHFIKKAEKRERISRETMEIYAPLARRIGLYAFASELEDLAFAQLSPEARQAILLRLEELSSASEDEIEKVKSDLEALLKAENIQGRVEGRRKQPYSIWRKLERKSISFSDVADIFAFRLIVEETAACYRLLGAAHMKWDCLPDRFHDFISVPKPNGYRSLHTTVRAHRNRRVELQIRTEDMHETAEKGIAAHWSYKNKAYAFDREGAQAVGLDAEKSLAAFADMLRESEDPEEFLEHAKLEMYQDQVFTFTPKGRLVVLPKGAMPLDFAYAVHTAIGDTCKGVKINGASRSLRTRLTSGDVIDIIRAQSPAPQSNWAGLAITGRARSAIRRLVRTEENAEFERLGHQMVSQMITQIGLKPGEVDLQDIAHNAGFADCGALYQSVGRGRFKTTELLAVAFPGHDDTSLEEQARTPIDAQRAPLFVAGRDLTPGVTLHFGTCCSPLPGERIIGVHTPEKGLIVHTIYCNQLAEFEALPWVDLAWTELAAEEAVAVGRIGVTAANRKGVLATLCTAMAEAKGNIIGVETGERTIDFIDLVFDVEVENLKRMAQILAALRSLTVVDRAERILESDYEHR